MTEQHPESAEPTEADTRAFSIQDQAMEQRVNVLTILALALAILLLCGCSGLKHYTVNRLGDTLAAGGAGYGGDDDPELIRQAAPFSLKLMENVLAESPSHGPLLTAAAAGFTQFAYAYVQQDADELEASDLTGARALRRRAVALYRRAQAYGLRALSSRHEDFETLLRTAPDAALAGLDRNDLPALYWSTVPLAATIALSKDDPRTIAQLPLLERLVARLRQLDEDYDHGALHGFLISYAMSRPGERHPEGEARRHFAAAIRLGGDERAAPYVTLAETVSVATGNRREFGYLLNRAAAMPPPRTHPEWRLEHELMQRRARWLLSQTDRLFLD